MSPSGRLAAYFTDVVFPKKFAVVQTPASQIAAAPKGVDTVVVREAQEVDEAPALKHTRAVRVEHALRVRSGA